MRRLATLAVVAALMSPTVASGQDYSFGDWARDQGYSPGDVMPEQVNAGRSLPAINSLGGIDQFDWTTTPTQFLQLYDNQISSIEPGDFSELTNLDRLDLGRNQISSIESDTFSGLTNLTELWLGNNQISSIDPGDFSLLVNLSALGLDYNQLSSIESGDFTGLSSLWFLALNHNQLANIESGAFSGLMKLCGLDLSWNEDLTVLNLADADLSGLFSSLHVASMSRAM